MGSRARIAFYEAQQKAGNLQLLCQLCHQDKTALEARQRAHEGTTGQLVLPVSGLGWHQFEELRPARGSEGFPV